MRPLMIRAAMASITLMIGVVIATVHKHLLQKQSAAQTEKVQIQETPATAITQAEPFEYDAYPENLGIRPLDIKFFIQQHPHACLDRLWERLGITDDADPLTPIGRSCGVSQVSTFNYNLDEDPGSETVLQIKEDLTQSYRYLIFKNPFYEPKLLGYIDAWAKYPPSDPFVLLSNGQAWLVVQSTGATGSGLGAWVDTIYQVSNRGVRPLVSYISEVHQAGYLDFPTKTFVARPVSCEIKGSRAIVTMSYAVKYFGRSDDGPLFTKQQTAVLVGSIRNGATTLDASRSDISQHEFETIYYFDSMGEDEFLRYNRSELRAIATGSDSPKKEWLINFLLTVPKNSINRELLSLATQFPPRK